MNDKRVELKYLVNIFDTNKLIRNLKSLPLNFKEKYKTRLVNNIYFDTQQNHSLQEHLNGIKNRYKIRIRWYGDFENFLKPVLEFKIKKNKITIKKKINLTDPNKNILNSKNEILMFLKKNLIKNNIVNFSSNFKISRIINYKRNYYEASSNKIRFTLDKDLKYKNFNNNKIVDENVRKFYQKKFNILELKCNYESINIIPFIEKNVLLKSQSFSKFIDYRY